MPKKEVAKRLALIAIFVLVIVLTFSLAAATTLGYVAYKKIDSFSAHAGLSITQIHELANDIWHHQPQIDNGRTNLLILGVDSLDTRDGSPPLTDTMVLTSIDTNSGAVNSISLPRDLWSPEYQTKINALYYYGHERYPDRPEQFAEETLEQMLGVPIHHVVVINMASLANMVDILGGIEIDVPNSFRDEKFPRPDVDVTVVTDPEQLYKTVEFHEGVQRMSGDRVLEFVRSRNSEGDEGTDLARTNRQQLVIQSLTQKLMNLETILNSEAMGKLLRYYFDNMDKYLSVTEAGSLAKSLIPYRDSISINSHSLSVFPDDQNGVIWNPPLSATQKQWVYEIRDAEGLQMEINSYLEYNDQQ